MTKKMHIVAPFVQYFTVENIYTGESFKVDCLEHALYYATVLLRSANVLYYGRALIDLFTESRHKNPFGWFVSVERKVNWTRRPSTDFILRSDVKPIIVYDNLGRVIEVKELAKHRMCKPKHKDSSWNVRRSQWYYHRELTDRNLCKCKGDGKKIKKGWSTIKTVDNDGETRYDIVANSFRSVNTKNEQTANSAHMDEYGQEMVRGKRRKLPTAWDDVQSSYWGCRRSWKHHSKRRKQWMPNS